MDKGWGGLQSPLLLPIYLKCDPRHKLWQLDTPVKTPTGQGGIILQWVHISAATTVNVYPADTVK